MRVLLVIVFALLSVLPARAQQGSGGDFFVEAVVDNPTPFVGEQITYSFRLYTAVPFDQPPAYIPPSFEGFWRTDRGPGANYSTQINGRFYTITQVDTALFPTLAQETRIEPAALELSATVFADGQRIPTNSVPVQVRPLPDGAPDGFKGAVGQFSMYATLDRQALVQGEPFTLQVTVVGTGNVEQLAAPTLELDTHWRIYSNPAFYESTTEDGILVGAKTFEWLLSAGETGTLTLPPVSLIYFDPTEVSYKGISTGSVTVNVLEGSEPLSTVPPIVRERSLSLKTIDTPLRVQGGDTSILFWVLWIFPPAILCACWLWLRQQATPAPDNSHNAAAHAQKALRRISPASDGYRKVREVVYDYLSARLKTDARVYTQDDLWQAMRQQGVEEETIERFLACLQVMDDASFGPEKTVEAQHLLEQTSHLLSEVDAQWIA